MYAEPNHALAEIIAGQGAITAVSFRQGRIKISLSAEEEVTLQVAHPYHSHWWARAAPRGRRLKTISSSQDGQLILVAPAGTQSVEITQLTTPAQWLGWALSATTVVLLAGVVLALGRDKHV